MLEVRRGRGKGGGGTGKCSIVFLYWPLGALCLNGFQPANRLPPPYPLAPQYYPLPRIQNLLTPVTIYTCKSRKEAPQKLTQLSSRSHPRHLVGKRTAQKDITIDTTSDSQVNSNFPNRWSPASLTFNNYFYLFLYLYIT